MNELSRFGVFAAAIGVGLILGGIIPSSAIKESWRLPIAVALVMAGIALAFMAWPSSH